MGAKGTNFDPKGSGPSDIIAYPNIYEVHLHLPFSHTVVVTLKLCISCTAQKLAQWFRTSNLRSRHGRRLKLVRLSALQRFKLYMAYRLGSLSIKMVSQCVPRFVSSVSMCRRWWIAPIAEVFSDTGAPEKIGADIWQLLPFSRGTVAINVSNSAIRFFGS